MARRPLDLHRLQLRIGWACLLGCLAADGWTLLFKRGEFLTSVSFTLLVLIVQASALGRRTA